MRFTVGIYILASRMGLIPSLIYLETSETRFTASKQVSLACLFFRFSIFSNPSYRCLPWVYQAFFKTALLLSPLRHCLCRITPSWIFKAILLRKGIVLPRKILRCFSNTACRTNRDGSVQTFSILNKELQHISHSSRWRDIACLW